MTKPVSHANAGENMHHLQKRLLGCYSQKDRYNSNNRDWGDVQGKMCMGQDGQVFTLIVQRSFVHPSHLYLCRRQKKYGNQPNVCDDEKRMRRYALQQETQTTKKRINLVLKDSGDDVGPGEGGVGGRGGGLGLLGRGSFQRKLIDIGNYIYH